MSRGSLPSRAAVGALPHAILIPGAIIAAAPFVWLACAALKRNEDFFTSTFLPGGDGLLGVAWERLTLEHMARVLGELGLGRALLNSIFLSSSTAVLATLVSAMGGYALARFEFRGRGWLTAIVLGALIIPPPLLMAPGYQWLFQLGLLDTFAGLVLPAIAPAFGVFLFRQSCRSSVPVALIEAARLDGAGEVLIFFRVAMPLLRPMVGAFILITFLGTWNNFISPQVVLQSPERFPLSVAIAQLKGTYFQDYGLLMAGTLISVVPLMVLFLLLQKEFISGLTAGAVKG
ncbi:MAG: carbohydrate ABC transporter permease [Phycisphaerales bacterium]